VPQQAQLSFSGTASYATINFQNTGGGFLVDNFTGTFGAVPEPSTWAMMLLGFGGMGMTMRRRRSQRLMQLA